MFENMFIEIQENNPALTEINLSGLGLKLADIERLLTALKSNIHITRLDLSNNQIGDQGAMALAKFLNTHIYLEEINLERNGISIAGIQSLAEMGNKNYSLLALQLWRTRHYDLSLDKIVVNDPPLSSERTIDLESNVVMNVTGEIEINGIHSIQAKRHMKEWPGNKTNTQKLLQQLDIECHDTTTIENQGDSISISGDCRSMGFYSRGGTTITAPKIQFGGCVISTSNVSVNKIITIYPDNHFTQSIIPFDQLIQKKLERNNHIRKEACTTLCFLRAVLCRIGTDNSIGNILPFDILFEIINNFVTNLTRLQFNEITKFATDVQTLNSAVTKTAFLQKTCFFTDANITAGCAASEIVEKNEGTLRERNIPGGTPK